MSSRDDDSRPDIRVVRRALASTLAARGASANGRAAAVAAILREARHGLEILFIRRAEREGDPWSGHMAFPGGRYQPSDPDLFATALRETREEIGLELERHAELVGVLEDQEATGGSFMTPLPTRPFVFELVREGRLELGPEVTEVLWAPLEPLLRGERATTVKVKYKEQDYALPGWDLEGRVVWGLTYRMTSLLLGKLR